VDALTQLLVILSVLSGLFLTLTLLCTLLARLPAYAVARPRRGRPQRTQRRVRTNRPRRRREVPDDLAALAAHIAQ
jgi:hypothetical protein